MPMTSDEITAAKNEAKSRSVLSTALSTISSATLGKDMRAAIYKALTYLSYNPFVTYGSTSFEDVYKNCSDNKVVFCEVDEDNIAALIYWGTSRVTFSRMVYVNGNDATEVRNQLFTISSNNKWTSNTVQTLTDKYEATVSLKYGDTNGYQKIADALSNGKQPKVQYELNSSTVIVCEVCSYTGDSYVLSGFKGGTMYALTVTYANTWSSASYVVSEITEEVIKTALDAYINNKLDISSLISSTDYSDDVSSSDLTLTHRTIKVGAQSIDIPLSTKLINDPDNSQTLADTIKGLVANGGGLVVNYGDDTTGGANTYDAVLAAFTSKRAIYMRGSQDNDYELASLMYIVNSGSKNRAVFIKSGLDGFNQYCVYQNASEMSSTPTAGTTWVMKEVSVVNDQNAMTVLNGERSDGTRILPVYIVESGNPSGTNWWYTKWSDGRAEAVYKSYITANYKGQVNGLGYLCYYYEPYDSVAIPTDKAGNKLFSEDAYMPMFTASMTLQSGVPYGTYELAPAFRASKGSAQKVYGSRDYTPQYTPIAHYNGYSTPSGTLTFTICIKVEGQWKTNAGVIFREE